MSSNLKIELADHICRYLSHEAQYSDLPEAAKESLSAASERIEQAYRLSCSNLSGHNSSIQRQQSDGGGGGVGAGGGGAGSGNSGSKSQKTANLSSSAAATSSAGSLQASSILPDELLRIFTRHKEFLAQQKDPINIRHSMRNECESSSSPHTDPHSLHQHQHQKPDIRVSKLFGQSSDSNVSSSPASSSQQQMMMNESSIGGSGGSADQQQQQPTRSKHGSHLFPGSHHHSISVSVHKKKIKQKFIALVKKFRTDGRSFDSEELYREALERELMKAAAGRGTRAIEELLEEDIEVEGESGSEPEDWDNISETSTPKPSLRPFFSSTTLDKI